MKILFSTVLLVTAISSQSFASLDEECIQKLQNAVGATYSTMAYGIDKYEVQQDLGIGYFSNENGKEIVDLTYTVNGTFQGFKADYLQRKYKVQVFAETCEINYLKSLK